jgi:hypothetical protein
MPVLKNPRHEAFALNRFRGETIDRSYRLAGYTPHRGNAARLNANESIKQRIAELTAEAANRALESISFEAVDMFRRLEQDIADAKAAGDHKSAIAGRIAMIEAFGYKDSPTLTHEHVRGKSLKQAGEQTVVADRDQQNVVRFSKAIEEMRKRIGQQT